MLKENVSLLPYNTFGIDCQARWYMELNSEEKALEFLVDNLHHEHPVWILGGGSNVLLTGDLDGLVIRNTILGREVVREDEKYVWLKVGAGENWHELVLFCLDQHWGGIENLSLIPGCVGAAPIQNIGAYGVELKDVFVELSALRLNTGVPRLFRAQDCQFGYRDSYFKRQGQGKYLITSVTLKLNKAPHPLHTSYGAIARELNQNYTTPYTIRDVSETVIRIRQSKLPDPAQIGNAGSFFKNPVLSKETFHKLGAAYPQMPHYPQADGQVKVPAGWLIQTAGWKGKRQDNYGVHAQQALVLVNYGGANGHAIYALSQEILEDVAAKFGIELEREVNIW
jgi:UDP-N-acetylmuramate dehydrogenase